MIPRLGIRLHLTAGQLYIFIFLSQQQVNRLFTLLLRNTRNVLVRWDLQAIPLLEAAAGAAVEGCYGHDCSGSDLAVAPDFRT